MGVYEPGGHRLLPLVVLVLLFGCSNTKSPIEGYRVVSHDSRTGQWTVIRNGTFGGEYQVKRLTLICLFYQRGKQEPITGKNACTLQIGRTIVPSFYDRLAKEFLDVYEMAPDRIAITEGKGEDCVSQHFTILKQELLSPRVEGQLGPKEGPNLQTRFLNRDRSNAKSHLRDEATTRRAMRFRTEYITPR